MGFDVLDDKVFAAVVAAAIVVSVVVAAEAIGVAYERFLAVGLLDPSCTISKYPVLAVPGQRLRLCIFLYNHDSYPALLRIVYRVATGPTMLPTDISPGTAEPLGSYLILLSGYENKTVRVSVTIPSSLEADRAILVFEVWRYDTTSNTWVYTGRWVHLYVRILPPP